jgi:hypothetical protein
LTPALAGAKVRISQTQVVDNGIGLNPPRGE